MPDLIVDSVEEPRGKRHGDNAFRRQDSYVQGLTLRYASFSLSLDGYSEGFERPEPAHVVLGPCLLSRSSSKDHDRGNVICGVILERAPVVVERRPDAFGLEIDIGLVWVAENDHQGHPSIGELGELLRATAYAGPDGECWTSGIYGPDVREPVRKPCCLELLDLADDVRAGADDLVVGIRSGAKPRLELETVAVGAQVALEPLFRRGFPRTLQAHEGALAPTRRSVFDAEAP
jgi:hypothetical protein